MRRQYLSHPMFASELLLFTWNQFSCHLPLFLCLACTPGKQQSYVDTGKTYSTEGPCRADQRMEVCTQAHMQIQKYKKDAAQQCLPVTAGRRGSNFWAGASGLLSVVFLIPVGKKG